MSSRSIDALRAGSPHLSDALSSNTSSLRTKIKTVAQKFFLHLELYYLWIPKKLYVMSNDNVRIISQSAAYNQSGHHMKKLSLYKRAMYAIWSKLETLTHEPARRYDMKHLELLSLSQSPSALSSLGPTTTTTTTTRTRTNTGSSSVTSAERLENPFSGLGSHHSSHHPQHHEASPSRPPATTTTTTTTVRSNRGGSTASPYFLAVPLYREYDGQPEPDEQSSLASWDDEERRVPDPNVAAPTPARVASPHVPNRWSKDN